MVSRVFKIRQYLRWTVFCPSFFLLLHLSLVPMSIPDMSHAHAVLVSSPLQNPVPAHQAGTTVLRFNVEVKSGFAEVSLMHNGEVQDSLLVEQGLRPNEVRVKLPPLPPGLYGLHYKILARDGHVTEDSLSFTVSSSE